ncbi:hypothetical protein BMS3Bbin02_00595 [bacterium BMS3Bbin02]|nr:hypothetical protein BMS3Bbin02_00595 [bacterium BMS3Bbin02]
MMAAIEMSGLTFRSRLPPPQKAMRERNEMAAPTVAAIEEIRMSRFATWDSS